MLSERLNLMAKFHPHFLPQNELWPLQVARSLTFRGDLEGGAQHHGEASTAGQPEGRGGPARGHPEGQRG